MGKIKDFEVTFKFNDVINTIEAETKEEAEKIANDLLNKDLLQSISKCYEIEVEEQE
jgi:hypothetical protein